MHNTCISNDIFEMDVQSEVDAQVHNFTECAQVQICVQFFTIVCEHLTDLDSLH